MISLAISLCQIMRPLYDGALYLDGHHKEKLKDEFGKFRLIFLSFHCAYERENAICTVVV